MSRAISAPSTRPVGGRQRVATALLALACGFAVQGLPVQRLTQAVEAAVHRVDGAGAATAGRTTSTPAFRETPDGLRLSNAATGLRGTVTANGLRIDGARGSAITLSASGLGRAGRPPLALPRTRPTATDETAIARRGPLTEWVHSRASGIEQGWTIPARPAGRGPLRLTVGVAGATVRVASATSLVLTPPAGRTLVYDGLLVRDARGHVLPARFVAADGGAVVRVRDAGAAYPIVVDPDLTSVDDVDSPLNEGGAAFGAAVAMADRWLVVGAPNTRLQGEPTVPSGEVTVYHDRTGNGDWQIITSLTPNGTPFGPASFPGSTGFGNPVGVVVEPQGVTVFARLSSVQAVLAWTFAGDPDTVAPLQTPHFLQGITATNWAAGFGGVGGFGEAFDASGDLLVVGAPQSTDNGVFGPDLTGDGQPDAVNEHIGTAEVFRRSGGFGTTYGFVNHIDPANGIGSSVGTRDIEQWFGSAVSIDPTTGVIAVGAKGDDGVRTPTGGTLAAPAAPGVSSFNGAVDLFTQVNPTTWSAPIRVTSDANPAQARFGTSLDLTPGDGLFVGANFESGIGGVANTGAAYLFDQTAPGTWTQVQRMTADDPSTATNEAASASQFAGSSVAVSPDGSRLYLGVPSQTQPATAAVHQGDVHVWSRPGATGAATFLTRLDPQQNSDAHLGINEAFGAAVAASNTAVAAGAPGFGTPDATLAGVVSAFKVAGTTYTPATDFNPTGHRFGAEFGQAVAQDGDVMAVSMPNTYRGSGYGLGAVTIYYKTSGHWSPEQTFFPNATHYTGADSGYGTSLALHVFRDATGADVGLVVAIGAPTASVVNPGAPGTPSAVTINRTGTVGLVGRNGPHGTPYTLHTELFGGSQTGTSASPNPTTDALPNALFGQSLAFTGDGTLIVGEPGANGNLGRIERYDRTGAAFTWTHQQTISEAAPGGALGQSVAADGTDVVALAGDGNGNAEVHRFTDGGPTTDLVDAGTFSSGAPTGKALTVDSPPSTVAISGSRIAVGSPAASQARIYRMVGSTAVPEAVLDGPTGGFGTALDFSHDPAHPGSTTSLLVGAPADSSGSVTAYVAKIKADGSGQWSRYGVLTDPDPQAGSADIRFGTSVTNWPANGGALVGAPFSNATDVQAGHVYAFGTGTIAPPPGPQAFVDVTVPPTVPVGASQLRTAGLPPSLLTQHSTTDGSIAAAPLGSIDLGQAPAGTTVTASPLHSIPLSEIPLHSIPLHSIPLSEIPLSGVDGGWEAVLAGTAFAGSPLQSVSLDQVYDLPSVQALPLGALSLAGSPLASIPLASIALGATPLSGLPLDPTSADPAVKQWCDALVAAGATPSAYGIDCANPDAAHNTGATVLSIGLRGAPLHSIPLHSIPLHSIDIAGTPLHSIPLHSIDLTAAPLHSIPLHSIPLHSIPLHSIPLHSISVNGTPLHSIPLHSIDLAGTPLHSIPLASLSATELAAVVDCSLFDCTSGTVGDAAAAGAVKDTAVLGDLELHLAGSRLSDLLGAGNGITAQQLGDALGALTVGDLTDFDNLTLGELPQVWPYLHLGDIQGLLGGVHLDDIAGALREYTRQQVQNALDDSTLTLADVTGWDDVTLGQVDVVLDYLTLGDLTPALQGIRLGDLVGAIQKPGGGTYSEQDLRDALDQAMPGATLGDITDFDNLTLGELAQYGDMTIGDLFAALSADQAGRITLGDLLLALIAPQQYPWQSLDIAKIEAQALDSTPNGSPVTVAYRADAPDGLPRTVRVTVELPHGARIEPASIAGDGSAAELVPDVTGGTATWTFTGVPANAPRSLTFRMDAPLTIGPASVHATAFLPDDDEIAGDTATTTIQEALEPNDTIAQATPLPDDTIELSHVSHAGDVDVYKFDVTDPGTRVSISLSNLDADLDATLYAPRDSTIVPTSGKSLTPIEDAGGSGLPAADQAGATTPQAGVADHVDRPTDLGTLAVVQGSYHRGRADEQIDTGVLVRTGTYYLAVTGYNGAVDAAPYALRVKRIVSRSAPACPSRTITPGAFPAAPPAALPAGTNTVFVVNRSRMAGLYGAAAAGSLTSNLDAFTTWLNGAGLGQKAYVLNVDGDPAVRAAYQQWDASPCLPSGANGVVSEIARILNGYRANGADLKNVVLVGGDDAVPFARVPDATTVANEAGYASTFSDMGNALFATFATSSVQSDNPYVDRAPYAFGNRTLYVPDATVGRLVESPGEISDQLTDFQNAGGRLAVGTGLVTGYDFLSDGAHAVADDVARTYATTDSHLISETWTRQDLESAIATLKPDLLSVNAHFDHYRALPGAGNTTQDESDLFQAAAVRGALNGDLAGSVVFSMGCHSGVSASDLLLGSTDQRSLDFAQAVASQGGVFVGNTGFGYGDTDTVALSEQLMGDFAQRLDGSMTVGEALLFAKNAYFSGLAQYTPYDEKVLQETTFYGLPFYRLDVPNPPSPPAPSSPILTPDDRTGLDTVITHLQPTYAARTAANGKTYTAAVDPVTGADVLTTVQGRPVEPRVDTEYALPATTRAHDGLVLGMTSVDTPHTDPYIFQPIIDTSGERVDTPVDTAFPTRAVSVNEGLAPAGRTFHVAATTGYFRTTDSDGTGIQRTYRSMDVQTFLAPAGNDDFTAPTFSLATAQVLNGSVTVSAHVMDDRGLASRVKRVRLLLLQDPPAGVATTWRGLDLVRTGDTDEWTGSLPTTGRNLELVLQAVDAAGNVGVTTDKAQNFTDQAIVGATGGASGAPGTPAPLTLSLAGPQGGAGWYTGAVTVTATGGSALTYEVVGETSPAGYQQPFTVTGTGLHLVRVTSSDGQSQSLTIPIDTIGPVPQLDSPAVGQEMPAAPGSLIIFSCPDAGSGSTSCTATLDGSPVTSGSVVPLPPGQHTVVVTTGPDRAGNAPSQATLTRTFTVVPAPATVGTIGVSKAKDGAVTTLTVPFTGYTVLTYNGTVAWGDGATTNCAMAGSGCTITRTSAGGGTLTATHTYPTSYVDTTATVSVIDNLGQSASATVLVNKRTTITATPALLQVSGGKVVLAAGAISATLKDGAGTPLANQSIAFTLPSGTTICTATTNASGVAKCPANLTYTLAMISAGRYNATFAGKDAFHGATTSASLIG